MNASQKNVTLGALRLLLRPCLGQSTTSLPAVSVASEAISSDGTELPKMRELVDFQSRRVSS